MITSWLHTLLGIKVKQRPKSVGKNPSKKLCENKETDSPSGTCIYRNEISGTCSLLKESQEKKMGLLFLVSGTPTF